MLGIGHTSRNKTHSLLMWTVQHERNTQGTRRRGPYPNLGGFCSWPMGRTSKTYNLIGVPPSSTRIPRSQWARKPNGNWNLPCSHRREKESQGMHVALGCEDFSGKIHKGSSWHDLFPTQVKNGQENFLDSMKSF